MCLYDLTNWNFNNVPGRATKAGQVASLSDQTKSNCFYSFLVLVIFSCRCPLPVVSPSLLPFLRSNIFLGFTVVI